MAVTAHDALGTELLGTVLTESPDTGERAIYQRIARAETIYRERADYTFLTLPGLLAVLSLSGSLLFVLLGMALATGVIVVTEDTLRRFNPNPFLASVAGMAMAVEVTQINFAYLALIFYFLLTMSLLVLTMLERLH